MKVEIAGTKPISADTATIASAKGAGAHRDGGDRHARQARHHEQVQPERRG
jgi:hypothetical protein